MSEEDGSERYRFIRKAAAPAYEPELPRDAPHILLAVDQFGERLGGGERIVMRLAALLPSYGFRVSILTLSLHPRSPVLNGPIPCPIFVLPLQRTWDARAFLAARELRRFLREQHIRLVQTFFESSDLWVGAIVKTVPDVRLVWSRRDMGILRTAKHRWAYKLLRALPDHVFAVSEEVRRYCLKVDRIPAERCTTVYNGVDVSTVEEEGAFPGREAPPRVLAVGNIRRVKGHDILVEAAALVHKLIPEAEFAIAGEPAEAAYFLQLQHRVAELGLENSIHFLGDVSQLREEFARATVFAMPSRSEGFSNAIIEAMAASLPVVATNVGGNAEAVSAGITGRVVPSESVEEFAQALLDLLENPAKARKMGAAGRERALRCFTTDRMMQVSAKVYHQLLSR